MRVGDTWSHLSLARVSAASLPGRVGLQKEGTRPSLSLACPSQVSSRKFHVLEVGLFTPSRCYKAGVLNEGFCIVMNKCWFLKGRVREALCKFGAGTTRLAGVTALWLQVHRQLKGRPLTISLCPVTSQIALKCADICNPCRIWEMSKQWSERVCEEFYRQG